MISQVFLGALAVKPIMKISEKWLREWVSPKLDTRALADRLTMAGLEVGAIEPVAPILDRVVVGEIVSVAP
ncbi:MAG: hypothetical protein AAB322_08950, partial [Pseudomonadota bacterium]